MDIPSKVYRFKNLWNRKECCSKIIIKINKNSEIVKNVVSGAASGLYNAYSYVNINFYYKLKILISFSQEVEAQVQRKLLYLVKTIVH